MSLEARTGRLRQRYDKNFRLVSGCIPYRRTKDAEAENEDIETGVEVLMVSSPNRSDLVFPKGGWENDETVIEAACREALEEAGVGGTLNEKPLGIWEFRSKSRQDLHSLEGGCRGYMFSLEVTEELEIWPEQENRSRKWLSIKDAFQLCRYDWMREALEEFVRVMTEEQKVDIAEEDIVEPLTKPVPDVVADCPIVPPSYCVTTTSRLTSFHWQILKRLPLT